MKRTVQVIYPEFVEIFDVDIFNGNLNIELKNIVFKPIKRQNYLTLNLGSEVKKDYRIFPFKKGDTLIVQVKNIFIVNYNGEQNYWVKFEASRILSYLFKVALLDQILPYIDEDKDLFMNSLFSDFIRTDYSYSSYNKKIKYAKVAILAHMISQLLRFDITRMVFDETVLGDVEITDIAMALRFADKKVLWVNKIDNMTKIITLLEKEKILTTNFTFKNDNIVINTLDYNKKINIKFMNSQNKIHYDILPRRNYSFEIGEDTYEMLIEGSGIFETVTGFVNVYNGDERDLMIR